MTAFINYFKDSYRELELVRWPTRQQAVRLSVIVLVFTVISSVLFGAVDASLANIITFILSNTL